MSETVCFICQKDLSSGDVTLVREKGVKSLCDSSKLRKKTDHTQLLGNLKQVVVRVSYGRAVRAHILVQTALASVIWDTVELSEEEIVVVERLLKEDQSLILDASDELKRIVEKFCIALEAFEANGPTSRLWVQYFKMLNLMKQFIEAERMGDWDLHLDTIKKMLPFFHAAGHLQYAKSAHLYIQDMIDLKEKMDPNEFDKFTHQGCFTIRSDKFWSGIWSDMTIEQTLMRSSKVRGGLSSGRGFHKESVLAKWTQGNIYLQYVCDAMESYCNLTAVTSEQHVDARPTRVARDKADTLKLKKWFANHPPFAITDVTMSISTGVVGGANVNCYLAQEKGKTCLKNMKVPFHSPHLKRKDKVITLADVTSSLKVGSDVLTAVDPTTLFQRICIAKQTDDDLKDYFTYELAPYPLSLFVSSEGLRKGTKSLLYNAFKPINVQISTMQNKLFVVDGGLLLHKVVWEKKEGTTFGSICNQYVSYVRNHYGSTVIVVFDGYPIDVNQRGTKSSERFRRSKMKTSVDIIFDDSTPPAVLQEKFLGNESNKSRLIQILKTYFQEVSIRCIQAAEDAVQTALSQSANFDSVIIVSEDVDVLVLLRGIADSTKSNVYLLKPGKAGKEDTYFLTSSYQYDPEYILFVHAFSGCDTTSSPFGHGKRKMCSLLEQKPALKEAASIFYKPSASPAQLNKAGEKLFIALYGRGAATLNELRYRVFVKMSTKAKFTLSRLPPTRDAAENHCFRVFYQVQSWLGKSFDPLKWGWRRENHGLTPIAMKKEAAPQQLLQLVFCSCKKGCTGACTCRKSGLHCTAICRNCSGLSCTNIPPIELEDDADEELEFEVTASDDEDELGDS